MKLALTCAGAFAALLAATICRSAPSLSPAADSDAVLAMRANPAGELRVEYRKEEPGKTPESVSIGISSDYHYFTNAEMKRIYDFKLRRIFSVRPSGGFVNDSLYAEVWYRAMELQNRAAIGRALKAGGVPQSQSLNLTETFWRETDLAMLMPDSPHPPLKKVEASARLRWLLDGDEVAAVRYGKEDVPEAVKPGLRRFWRTVVQLHPDIADAIAANGRMPAELWVKAKPLGKDPVVTHWSLTSLRWDPSARFPLPSHLAVLPAIDAGAFPEMFATLSKYVAEKALPPAADFYTARADEAIGRGAGLEAILWVSEMSLAQGQPFSRCEEKDPRPYCVLSIRAGPFAKTDPRTQLGFMPQSPDEEARPQFANLPNAYFLRLLWATRRPGKGVQGSESAHDLLVAIKTRALANFCKDAGDFYAGVWQPFAAWQVWDFGRLMANHQAGDLLGSIDSLESNLAEHEPEFF